ncbi:MAG: glycerate kinase type-2 family protein [Thermoprotei archaeon]
MSEEEGFPPKITAKQDTEERKIVVRLLSKALASIDPFLLSISHIKSKDTITVDGIDLGRDPFLVAVGKASGRMALAAARSGFKRGIVVVPKGYTLPLLPFKVIKAGHPKPDRDSLAAAKLIIDSIKEEESVLFEISGGASALMEMPEEGLELEDLSWAYDALTKASTPIQDINEVRKHLSALKGGKLAARVKGKAVSLVLSDVPGDDLNVVGSAPTLAAKTTLQWAKKILEERLALRDAPERVLRFFERGTEQPSASIPTILVGGNADAVRAAVEEAGRMGYKTLSMPLGGEARDAALSITSKSFSGVIIAGGETTVTLNGPVGRGGRNQELALWASLYLRGRETLGALATDGIDGPTDAAGALVDETTRNFGSPEKYLSRHDSYEYLAKSGDLIKTGPTGTNVSDVVVFLRPP